MYRSAILFVCIVLFLNGCSSVPEKPEKLSFSSLPGGDSSAELPVLLPEIPEAPVIKPLRTFDSPYDKTLRKEWTGVYNQYPSSSSFWYSRREKRGEAGRSLVLQGFKKDQGDCGVWVRNLKENSGEAQVINAETTPFLSFFVKGQRGGEDLEILLEDSQSLREGKNYPAGTLSAFLEQELDTQWQEVVIPLKNVAGLNTKALAGIAFQFETPGDSVIYVDDISLKNKSKARVGIAKSAEKTDPALPGLSLPRSRAMWVWNTAGLLRSRQKQKDLFAFCEKKGISVLFMQLSYTQMAYPGRPVETYLRYPDSLELFIRRAHRKNLKIHGLLGYPDMALRENYPLAESITEALLKYNQGAGGPPGRYDGLHVDVRPRRLLGYADPHYRKEIFTQYLDMHRNLKNLLQAFYPEMDYGADFPGWFDSVSLEWQEQEKKLSEHLIDIVDNAGLLAYRNRGAGFNGFIDRSYDELLYAGEQKKDLYIGIETEETSPRNWFFVWTFKKELFERSLHGSLTRELRDVSRFRGYPLRFIESGDRIHVGLRGPVKMEGDKKKYFFEALYSLAELIGAPPADPMTPQAKKELINRIQKKEDLLGFRAFFLSKPGKKRAFQVFQTDVIVPPEQSFNRFRSVFLEDVLADSEERLARFSGFKGFSLHCYRVYSQMVD